jgi:hypothetical protein
MRLPLFFAFAAALGVGGLLLLSERDAEAAPANLGPKAWNLLASSGFQVELSAVEGADTISLLELTQGAAPASSWASAERGRGLKVLVPAHFVNGSTDHGAGQPTTILGVSAADAATLVGTGLYVEATP